MPHIPPHQPTRDITRLFAECLDAVDIGILRLDADLRVCFANRRFMEIWAVRTDLLAAEASLRDILSTAGNAVWRSLPPEVRLPYLNEREEAVRAGAIPPHRLDLTDGRHLLSRCDTCADGGRILTYIDITDQVHAIQLEAEAKISAELRFSATTMENEAAHMAELAEAAEMQAQTAETARILLAQEIVERRELEAKLRVLATTDGLTGALNRAAFLAEGQREIEKSHQSAGDVAALMVDVDHFKSINDRDGHAGGDQALRHLVTIFQVLIRRSDLLGRLGGEEFAVLLPGTSFEAAAGVAERLRAQVAAMSLAHLDQQIAMTISIGLAMRQPNDRSVEQILARADHALYQAKQDGRNRVVVQAYPAVAA